MLSQTPASAILEESPLPNAQRKWEPQSLPLVHTTFWQKPWAQNVLPLLTSVTVHALPVLIILLVVAPDQEQAEPVALWRRSAFPAGGWGWDQNLHSWESAVTPDASSTSAMLPAP